MYIVRLLGLAAATLWCALAYGQTTGGIRGQIVDAGNQNPVKDAVVIARSPALQAEQSATTAADGEFSITLLPPGIYSLRVEATGYKPFNQGDIKVPLDGTIRVKLAVTPELLEQALTEKTWSVGLLGGYGSWKTPRVRTGTLISGGPGSERDAVESEKHIRSYLAGLRMETPWGAIDFEYVEGDEKSRATEPVGGAQVGFVYYQPASSGSLGLNTGANGGRFRIETELKQYELRYTAPYLFHRSLPAEQYISEKSPEFIFGRTETRYSSSARSINLPGIFTKTHQKVEENRFGIGIRGNHTRRLTDSITGTVGANVALYYRDAELDSTQRNVCGAPGCPAANTFTANNTDSDSGFTWGAGVSARLDYSFTRHSSLGIQFNYDYLNETAALKNPTSTINISGPPHLESTSVYAWRGALRYRYTF